jgi:hypothetical protein
MKRTVSVAAAAVLGLAGLAAAPAMADAPPKTNSAAYWSELMGLDCSKAELGDGASSSWVADGDYALVLVKGGSVDTYGLGPGITPYFGVVAGDVVTTSANAGGQAAGISWLMTCEGEYGSGGGSAS